MALPEDMRGGSSTPPHLAGGDPRLPPTPPPPGGTTGTETAPGGGGAGDGFIPPPGGAATPASDNRHPVSEEDLLRRFPYMRWMIGVPELKALLDRSYTEGWSSEEFEANLWGTTWWRTRSESARTWDEGANRDPGQATRKKNARRTWIGQQANQLGIQLSYDEMETLVEQSLRWDFTTEEIMASLGKTGTVGMGSITETRDKIIADARSYYLDFDEETAMSMARRIETGDLSYDAITSQLRRDAKTNYSQFAGAIDDGLTLYEATLGIRQTVAEVLEMRADDIDFRQPDYAELIGMVDDKGNKMVPTIGAARRWARKQPAARRTEAAMQKATNNVIAMKRMNQTSAVFG